MKRRFNAFAEFYPFYLNEHRDGMCRFLHFTGSCTVLAILGTGLVTGNGLLFLLLPVAGYGFAWTGHFFFEKNRPATFKHPFYSFVADWVMMKDIILGRIPMFGTLEPQGL